MASTDATNFANELRRYSLKNAQIYVDKPFGHGLRSSVYEVRYMGLKCAGKRIHRHVLHAETEKTNDDIVKRFILECHQLSQVRHPNIVQFLGVYFQQGERAPILVMEFLPTNLDFCIDHYGILPKEISYSIFYDVALGLCYLHSQNLTHRNLNSKKILLTSNMTAKISDLGMAKIIRDVCNKWTYPPGEPSFMAPEANIKNPNYDAYADTFSFGIIMLHVLCGKIPIPELPATHHEDERRKEYLDQEIVKEHPLRSLILRCIRNNPKERPETLMIVEELERLIDTPDTFEGQLDMLKDVIKDMKPKRMSSAHKQVSEESQPDDATKDRYPKDGPELETTAGTGGQSVPNSPQGVGSAGAHAVTSTTVTTDSKHSKFENKVGMGQLIVLKYVDKGEEKEVRIIDEAISKWKEIGYLVYPESDSGKVTALEKQYKDHSECLRQIFVEGFLENEPKNYSQDWNGLIILLNDVNLVTLAKKVKHALTLLSVSQ